jgi:hypothetical protein
MPLPATNAFYSFAVPKEIFDEVVRPKLGTGLDRRLHQDFVQIAAPRSVTPGYIFQLKTPCH